MAPGGVEIMLRVWFPCEESLRLALCQPFRCTRTVQASQSTTGGQPSWLSNHTTKRRKPSDLQGLLSV